MAMLPPPDAHRTTSTHRRNVLVTVQIVVVLAVAVAISKYRGAQHDLRRQQHRQSAMAHAEPIIRAVEQYIKDWDAPPPKLESLRPKYLAAIPAPGELSRQDWYYRTGDGTEEVAGGWSLGIQVAREWCRHTLWAYEFLVYHPSGKHTRNGYGATRTEQIGSWGYYVD